VRDFLILSVAVTALLASWITRSRELIPTMLLLVSSATPLHSQSVSVPTISAAKPPIDDGTTAPPAPFNQPPRSLAQLLKQPPRDVPIVKLSYEPGGLINEHWNRFREMAASNSRVEVLHICASACTLVMTHIKKDDICFGPDAKLKFHQARQANGDPAYDTTMWMYNSYPADIRAWIDARGGPQKLVQFTTWDLAAPELWQMGYRRCDILPVSKQ
jgi:hypothetical protein